MAKNKIDATTSSSHNDINKKKKKKTKNLLSGPAATAMKVSSKQRQQAKVNPFEIMWARKKFDILGKKRKGEEKISGQVKSQSIEKRKRTLKKEYEESKKSTVFVDKRIGEHNDNIPEHEKAILRIQRKYQLKAKKSKKFNLEDDDEGGDFAIPLNDDFDEHVASDEDYDSPEGSTSAKYLNLYAGDCMPDNEAGENVRKTKKQVMAEIILKSKHYKAQKAKDKEADEKLIDKLDHDFASLAQNEALASLTQPTKMNALKAIANSSSTSLSFKRSSTSVGIEPLAKEKPDAYDKIVKEMSLDMRARPSDRTKTPEETAQEERERLETLEEERRKRMQTTNDSSDEDNSDYEDLDSRTKRSNAVSGDDLGDSFSVNEVTGITAKYEKENDGSHDEGTSSEEGSESDEDEDQDGTNEDDDHVGKDLEKMTSIKDWEQSDDDDLDLDEEEEEEEAFDAIEKELAKRNIDVEKLKNSSAEKESLPKQEALPYVIEAPNNLEELCSLLDNCSDEEVIVAINRIRACNSIRLAAENRRKMQVFYGILLQYFAVLATQKPILYNRLNALVKPLIEMSNETPYFAAICARQRLQHTRTRFCEDIKIPGRCSWPSMKTLLLLRLWSLIFPCSDFRHVVMTPAILLMCEYLMRCPILSGRDVAIGSFLCTMVLSVAKQSQKFFPEAIIFLQALLSSSFDSKSKNSQCHHLLELQTSKPWLRLGDQTAEVHPLDFFKVMDMEADSPFFTSDNFKASVLLSLVGTLKGFVTIYENLSSFPEIFLPLNDLLHTVQKRVLPGLLESEVNDVIDLIKKKADEHHMLRTPLQMRKQKPVPIKLLNPKFEESFEKGRDYDPDRERVERKKLKKRLKMEAKGAVRELRKDNYFVFGLKEKDRLQQEEERSEKYGKARAFLQEQEHAFKSGQLGKGRKRRR